MKLKRNKWGDAYLLVYSAPVDKTVVMADNVMGNQTGASGHVVKQQPSCCPATRAYTPHTKECKVSLVTHHLTVLQPFLSDLTHNPLSDQ